MGIRPKHSCFLFSVDEQLHALNHSNAGLRKRLQKTQLSPDNNRTSHIIDSMLQPFKGVFD